MKAAIGMLLLMGSTSSQALPPWFSGRRQQNPDADSPVLRAIPVHEDELPKPAVPKDEGVGPPPNVGFCNGYKVYDWPVPDQKLKDAGRKARLAALGRQINLYSETVGVCYGRDLKGATEKIWASRERVERSNRTYSHKSPRAYCDSVRDEFVKKLLPISTEDPSPFCQYGNCGEGAQVGACLALEYGFQANEVISCQSKSDHAWSLVPEVPGSSKYCLLDRWNSYRCGVTFTGKEQRDQDGITGWNDVTAKVPGKSAFKFSDAVCVTLETRSQM